jgi:hypothetical protein
MANAGQFVLQVSDFTLAGIDKTLKTLRIKGNAIPIIVPGSVNTATVVAGGSGWVVGDLFTLAKAPGAIFKVATVSTGAMATVTVVKPAGGATATTADVATAIAPSVGISATVTTTVNTGSGGLLIITGFSIASSVVTFNVVNALTGGGGQTVIVQGFTGQYAYLNGSYTTSTATASTVTAAITAPNVAQTSVYATMTVQPSYVIGGIPVSFNFVDQLGLPRAIGGIGPLSNPNLLLLRSKSGSTFEYNTNTIATNTTPLVRVFNWASTAGEVAAGALPADVIGFLAEFAYGSF